MEYTSKALKPQPTFEMRCEPQKTVLEREVRYYRCPSLINDQLLRRARRKGEEEGTQNIF